MPHRPPARAAVLLLLLAGCAADPGDAPSLVPGVAADAAPVVTGERCGDPSGDATGAVDLSTVTVEPVGDRVGVGWTWGREAPDGSVASLTLVVPDDDGADHRLVARVDGDQLALEVLEPAGRAVLAEAEVIQSGTSLTVLLDPAVLGLSDGAAWRVVAAVDGAPSDRCPDA